MQTIKLVLITTIMKDMHPLTIAMDIIHSLLIYYFGTETMVLPINHPMVIDISPAVRMFNNRFLPQLLTIEKIKCKKATCYIPTTSWA